MYLVYLENYRTKEHISIGVFSTYKLAENASRAASEYWNYDQDNPDFLATIVSFEVDKLPNYIS